jgi:hypothetical protein
VTSWNRQQRENWGAKVIDRLAADLRRAFSDMKGFSPRNLKYMRAFAEAWHDEAIVQAVLAQITWYEASTKSPSATPTAVRRRLGRVIWPLRWILTSAFIKYCRSEWLESQKV